MDDFLNIEDKWISLHKKDVYKGLQQSLYGIYIWWGGRIWGGETKSLLEMVQFGFVSYGKQQRFKINNEKKI